VYSYIDDDDLQLTIYPLFMFCTLFRRQSRRRGATRRPLTAREVAVEASAPVEPQHRAPRPPPSQPLCLLLCPLPSRPPRPPTTSVTSTNAAARAAPRRQHGATGRQARTQKVSLKIYRTTHHVCVLESLISYSMVEKMKGFWIEQPV